MSFKPNHSRSSHKGEHGTTRSYIIGFLLSLIFTAIPYYLVVSKAISGTLLLTVILVIAVLQMIIQIIFFLHLGREPKPLYNVLFFIATVGTILLVVVGSIWIMNHLNYNMAPTEASKKLIEKEGIYQIDGEKTGACREVHTNHKVIISGGQVSNLHTEAQLCDTLTFINEDDMVREITFGSHPQHGTYSGDTELTVRKGRSKTITLNQEGTYQFHDHLDSRVTGIFTVTP
jgi:cytochrome o ubiquinol oxidase operon protein cyoD